eukprot:COSAG01_NODE_9086_length_2561_cov_14.190089_2_plen_174_part_00
MGGGGAVSGGGGVCCLLSLSNKQPLLLCAAPSAFPGRTIASYTLLDAEDSGAARGASWAGLGCAPTNCSAVRGARRPVHAQQEQDREAALAGCCCLAVCLLSAAARSPIRPTADERGARHGGGADASLQHGLQRCIGDLGVLFPHKAATGHGRGGRLIRLKQTQTETADRYEI